MLSTYGSAASDFLDYVPDNNIFFTAAHPHSYWEYDQTGNFIVQYRNHYKKLLSEWKGIK